MAGAVRNWPQRSRLNNRRECQQVPLGACRTANGPIRSREGWQWNSTGCASFINACQAAASELGVHMDWNRVEGNWKQMTGKVKEKWGQLTDDDLTQVNGKREQLEGKLQERYGYAKDQTKKEVDDWFNTLP
jgi:uncharacterized protein YjbJ (UPF0337 family)